MVADEYEGTIKSYNDRKGWGFIQCEETEAIYGKDVLFQKGSLQNGIARPGDSVTFQVTDGRNGVLAINLRFHSNGQVPASIKPATNTKKLMGTIKSFNAAKGWGFIESEAIMEAHGKDILFQKAELHDALVNIGDVVSFSTMEGKNGLLAVDLQFPHHKNYKVVRGRYFGTVKSFNPQKGWGFIECDATHRIYGKDIILLKNELGGEAVEPGQKVRFGITQGNKGPLATSVEVLFASGGRVPRPTSMVIGQAPWPNFPAQGTGHKHPASTGAGQRAGSSPVQGAEPMCGTIKSFDHTKRWGFITGSAITQIYGKDIYVAADNVADGELQVGSQVKFDIEMGIKGPMAKGVIVLPDNSFSADGAESRAYAGNVKSFNTEKGWGFVTSDETMQLFGKDLFLHKRELQEGVPNPGDFVQFIVQLNQKGVPEAAQVSSAAEYAPVRKSKPASGAGRSRPY
mmetsp:Transcript_45704/g.126842  ORF Transcript_45704/g.126842 Transcript_45704/m.126842 type:complete len:457 (-) Transcript_45704:32-1402(-)